MTGHFQRVFGACLFNIYRKKTVKTSKTSKVNQQSVLNLQIFHHLPKNLDWSITFNSVTLKIHRQNLKNILFFFSTKQIIFRVSG